MSLALETYAAARLEMGEVARSRWPILSGAIYAVLAGLLVLVGLRESSVLGFSGMNRILLSFTHVLLVVLPLLALAATAQQVSRARDDGTLELLLSHPLSRTGYLLAVTLTRYLVLVVPLVVLLLAMTVIASLVFGEQAPWGMALRSAAVGASLLWAFVGIGLLVSTRVRNQARAVVYALIVWVLAVAVLDLGLVGLLLQWRLDARTLFVLASLNPVQTARLALLSGLEPDLGTLGPVGFFLAHRIGSAAMLVLGLAWPFVLGSVAWALALRSFRRGDLV